MTSPASRKFLSRYDKCECKHERRAHCKYAPHVCYVCRGKCAGFKEKVSK